jgi:hypothetical protein
MNIKKLRRFPPSDNDGDVISSLFEGLLYSHHYQFRLRGDNLAEKKGSAEEAAEKTGELVGKGLKKGFGVAKAFGKGAKDAVEKKEEKK